MIPKIIHQTAPSDSRDWHSCWQECHNSFKQQFPEDQYKHILWLDEDVDNLIKEKYPQYWDQYSNITPHIVKIDISRFFILYEYGGIYSDMDIYCYKNFYDDIKDSEISIIGSHTIDEVCQNSLMISTEKNDFFMDCINESMKRSRMFGNFNLTQKESEIYIIGKTIRTIAGPILLTKMIKMEKYKKLINILDNNHYCTDRELKGDFYIKHLSSGSWGNDTREMSGSKMFSLLENSDRVNYI